MEPRWRVILDQIEATDREREAVEAAAHAMIRWENESELARDRGEGGRFAAIPYPHPTGEMLLDAVCNEPRRWSALAAASIYRAEEVRGRACGATRVIRHGGDNVAKLMAYLTDNADTAGMVRLTLKGAADKMGCCGETVFRSLRKLEAAGEIVHVSKARRGAHGHFLPDVWRLVGTKRRKSA